MKREMELVRAILLAMESEEANDREPVIEGYTPEQVREHVRLMKEAGLVDANLIDDRGALVEATPRRILWEGHEFIDNARNATVWAAVKTAIAKSGGLGFEVVKVLLARLATDYVMREWQR